MGSGSNSASVLLYMGVFYSLVAIILGLIPASFGGSCGTNKDITDMSVPEETGVTSFIGGAWDAIVFMVTIGFSGCTALPSIIGLFFIIPNIVTIIALILLLRGV